MTTRHLPRSALLRPLSRAFASALLLAASLWALPAQAEDPPLRAARVAETQGTAWVFDAETKDWQRLTPNQTLGEGDRIRTERDGRLALRVGSTSLWLDDSADLELSRLDEDHLELLLARGQLGLRLRNAEAVRELQVRTREGRFFFERKGLYRVDQLDRGSRAFNWEGELRFEARAPGTPPVWLQPNEQAEFWWGEGPRVERQVLERDRFADWLLGMSRSEGDLPAYRYVSPEMTGAEDLDRYGRWEQAEEYGTVWIPQQVAPDWAPYRYGRWVWTRHWGWSWVDDAPWGFAPFHYGRWVMVRERWCWVPGRYVPRPVYAPALVAWVGGPGVSVGISIGSRPLPPRYGWYPLAPREVYVPSYRHSPHYGQRINREHDPVTVVHRGSAPPPLRSNREVRGAVSIWNDAAARPVAHTDANVPLRPLPQAPGRQDWRPAEARGDAGVPLRSQPPQGQALPAAPALPGHPVVQEGLRRDAIRGRGDRDEPGVPLRGVPTPVQAPPAINTAVQPPIQPQVQQPVQQPGQPPAAVPRIREEGPPLRRLPEQPARQEGRESALPQQALPDRSLQERLERDRQDRERADRDRQDRERLAERERQERQQRFDLPQREQVQREQMQREQMQREQMQREQMQREQQQRELQQRQREQMQREQQREVPLRQIQPERVREPERAREPVRAPEPPRVAPPQRQEEARPARQPQQDNVPRKGRQDER